jgi:putative transposase
MRSSRSRVLREQGVRIAARTYRAWRQGRVAARTVTDALRSSTRSVTSPGASRCCPTGRRAAEVDAGGPVWPAKKMTALIRRTAIARCVPWGRGPRNASRSDCKASPGRRRIRTTIPAKDGVRAGDLLNRDFTAPRPDHTWVTDFTYVRTWAGWVYVAFILDVFAQRIVAWHAQTTKHTDLVMIPLRMALWERDRQGHTIGPGQLIHHSDAGSQYTSIVLTEHLALEQIAPSIGSVGDAFDNALMETINGLYKAECVRTTIFHDGPFKTIADVEYATAGWVDWYNHRRLHGSLGMVSPDEYEAAYYAALSREPLPA